MLEIRGLRAGYLAHEVLHGVDLTVGPGQLVALLGHNGAGKSALLKAAFGLVRIFGGTVRYEAADTTQARPFEKSLLGIRFVPQEGNVFPGLTVQDNLRLGGLKMGERSRAEARIGELYASFPILRERSQVPARVLSGGERQMLAMSIALMTSPRVLLLDEPSSGLAPILVTRLFDMIRTIHRDLGTAVLLVEQNVNEALALAGDVYVLEEGRVVFHGPSSEKEAVVRHLWRLAGTTSEAQP